jgi:pimeloyl-ACP methyl ester carboxylesterase
MPRRTAAALLVATALLAACGGDDEEADAPPSSTTTATTEPSPTTTAPPTADALNGFEPAPLEWESCGGGLECADLAVPLDWDDPTGPTIDLAVARIPATGDDPLGAIATNPGGPGASGIEFLQGGVFAEPLSERFDTLSWDPRGVGGSAPLGCDGAEVDEFVRLDSDPDDAAEAAALDAGAQAVADACGAAAADLLPHVGTGSVVRDLEAIRRAYGDDMAYMGFSYGTAIGLEYLELLPDAMPVVLDGVVDPTHALTDLLRGQAEAFDRVVGDVFASCPAGQEGCPDGGAEAAYDELAAEVEEAPIPAGDDELGPSDLTTAALLSSYDESLWEPFVSGLAAAQDGDGSALLELADLYRGLGAFDLYQAVECLDSEHPVGGAEWAAFAAELEAISPRFGAAVANEMLPCAFWPVPPDPVIGPVAAEGSGPVVVIGTTGDAATPLAQAERVADGLADGRLVVYEGEGHTAYLSSPCVQDVVAAFLLDGTAPADGTTC